MLIGLAVVAGLGLVVWRLVGFTGWLATTMTGAGNDGERQTVAAHGQRFTVAATARDTTCRAHAFGRVANYLDEHPCWGRACSGAC